MVNAPAGRPSSSLHFVVGEMSGKLDQILLSLNPRLEALERSDTNHDQRITALEVWQGRALGGGGVILFLVTSWEVISHVIKR